MSDEIYPHISKTVHPLPHLDKIAEELYERKLVDWSEEFYRRLYGENYYRSNPWTRRINWNRLIAPRYTHYEIKILIFYKEWKYRIKKAIDVLKGKEYE